MTDYSNSQAIESLAAEIGENIYIDVAKWHLYLSNAHLHTVLAEKVSFLLEKDSVNKNELNKILSEIMVEIGGGKGSISLQQLLPKECEENLLELIEEFKRNF